MMNRAYSERSGLNRFWLGFLIGLLLPVVCALLYFLFRFHDITIGHFFQLMVQTGKIVHVMSLSVFPNLVPFMFFVRTDRYRSGRGIMAITIGYGLLIFALKLLL